MPTQPAQKPWYLSFKLIALVVGLVLIFVNAFINRETIDPEAVTYAVMGIVGFYVSSKAYEDSQQAQARATVTAANVAATAQATTTTISTPGTSDVQVQSGDTAAPVQPPSPMIGRMG